MLWFKNLLSRRYLGIIVLICCFIALLLAGKNPFDDQSLIPNLEPYPDSLYYAYPAWNVAHGGDFSMSYAGTTIKNVVPPIFSVYLLPFFAFAKDVRFFYFAQLVLLCASVGLLIVCLKLISDRFKVPFYSKGVALLVSAFFFVTNFYIYTMPSLLMAELISLFVLLCGCVLLLLPVNAQRASMSAHVGAILLLIKISNLPLAAAFYSVMMIKIWRAKERRFFMSHIVLAGLYTLSYFYLSSFFVGHKNLQTGSSFNVENSFYNLPFYLRAMAGYSTTYLWYSEKLVSPLVAGGAFVGLVLGFLKKETRNIAGSILLGAFMLIIFMSFFVTPDARYISALIPFYSLAWMIGLLSIFALCIPRLFLGLIGIVCVFYMVAPAFSYQAGLSEIGVIKKQIGLNYLHPENPWNYTAVTSMDAFIASQKSHKPIYIATFLPQFYVGMFAKNFTALPISGQQEFYSSSDEKIITNMHLDALNNGTLYMSNAYVGNVSSLWPKEFEKLKEKYHGTLVYEGCLGTCNLYLLSLPK